MRRIDLELEKIIEKTIEYLSNELQRTGHNSKPVLFHSIRVGLDLFNLGYCEDVVIGALLHDIVEDTDISLETLKASFSEKVINLIIANSFDKEIENEVEQFKELFKRCRETGREALIIKAADIFDNSHYFKFANEKKRKVLFLKTKSFLEISKELIENEEVWSRLNLRYIEILRSEENGG